MRPDEYRGYPRALYQHDPHLFRWWAEEARRKDLTVVDTTGDGLAEVLYDALCKVAEAWGFRIDG